MFQTKHQYRKGFTLLELLFSIALISTLLVSSFVSVKHFQSRAKLLEARGILDTQLIIANTNSLTGKSQTADLYLSSLTGSAGRTAKDFQPSHYFLTTKTSQDETTSSYILYGEMRQVNNVFEILFVRKVPLPYPVFFQEILYTPQDAPSLQAPSELLMVFDAPFGRVRFSPVIPIAQTKEGDSYRNYASLHDIEMVDMAYSLQFSIPESLKKGTAEWGLQYANESDFFGFIQREYVKFDSSNKISHYWSVPQ